MLTRPGLTRNNIPTTLYEYQGQWLSLFELGHQYGISKRTLESRIKAGLTIDVAITRQPHRGLAIKPRQRHVTQFEYPRGSGSIKTLKEITTEAGKAYHTVYARLQRGWSLEEALACR